MFGLENAFISSLLVNVSKILFGLSLIYIILKMLNRKTELSWYPKIKNALYQIHINTGKFATILGIAHAVFVIPQSTIYWVTGTLFGAVMIILLGLGAYMSIKLNKPMTEQENSEWRKIRLVKWLLTIFAVVFIALHYFWV